MTIGLTDISDTSDKLKMYIDWLSQVSNHAEIIMLSHDKNNINGLKNCDLIVLPGGGDVHPKFYRKKFVPEFLKGVNKERDEFEIELIHRALKNKIPVLGICRGLQMFNVALGGTLIMDLQKSGYKNHRIQNYQKKNHKIDVYSNSFLSKVIGSGSKMVNTSHHQAIDDIGKDLKASAMSTDGVFEAAEWNNPIGKSPLLLVQWHPERIETSLTSKKIMNNFIKKI